MKKIDWFYHILNFIAICLGVLLAFQVGSFAERKKEKKELKEILHSFIIDLETDIDTYDTYQIPKNELQVEALGKMLELIVNGDKDSLASQLSVAFNLNNYRPISSTYLSVSSSGKIGLIKDFEIKKKISDYYNISAKEAEKQGEFQLDFFMKEIIPWMIKDTDMLDVDSEDVVGNTELANQMILYKSFVKNKTEKYKQTRDKAQELKQALTELL